MASINQDLNNDLTTDACPSPPRDNSKPTDNGTSDQKIPNEEEINMNHTPTYKTQKTRGFSKVKKNATAPAFAASVINITHSSGVHIGSKNTVIMNNKSENPGKKNKDVVETDAIRTLLVSKTPLTREHLVFISTHMDEGWRDIARILNYSDGQISQFYESHFHSGIKEVIYQFLLDWIQNEPSEAIEGRLATILWETNQKDAVQRWSLKKF